MITRIRMPRRDNGQPVPNPVRYVCNRGHLHPSHRTAVACNVKTREETK